MQDYKPTQNAEFLFYFVCNSIVWFLRTNLVNGVHVTVSKVNSVAGKLAQQVKAPVTKATQATQATHKPHKPRMAQATQVMQTTQATQAR